MTLRKPNMALMKDEECTLWYVMRDLKRANAKEPAYKMLADKGFNVFTPMQWKLVTRQGKRIRERQPFMRDLLFVRERRSLLDPVVDKIPTFQYRYGRGRKYRDPLTVSDTEMRRFITAVSSTDTPRYYLPEEITAAMYGRRIRIVGGPLDGYEGSLLTMRGSKVKRLLVELKGFLCAGVEVNPEYIQFVE